MEILTYPIGILIGLFPVIADLGPAGKPADLRLDGTTVCRLSVEAPACLVDLGSEPAPHRLELVRDGERVERWVNRPGEDAEVRAAGTCHSARRQCAISLSWAHPGRLSPASTRIAIDGVLVAENPQPRTTVPFPAGTQRPRLLTAEAEFPDGRHAVFTKLFEGDEVPETARASLQAVLISFESGTPPADLLTDGIAAAGGRALEVGEAEVIFVVEPGAFARLGSFYADLRQDSDGFRRPLADLDALRLLTPNESLSLFDLFAGGKTKEDWFVRLLTLANAGTPKRTRIADAVTTAGYRLGGLPRRRAIVLVLSDRSRDESAFTPEAALGYLREIGVPLIVWRIGDAALPSWPRGRTIARTDEVPAALALLKNELRRQRIVWVEPDGWHEGRLPEGVRFASAPAKAGGAPLPTPPARASGSSGEAVYALAAGPADSILAATSKGPRQSADGRSWDAIPAFRGSGPVFAVAATGDAKSDLLLGGGASLHRSIEAGSSWANFSSGAIFCLTAAPTDARVLYAGGRADLLRSDDGGLTWNAAARGLPETFLLDVLIHALNPLTAWAATAGSGVYFTRDGGRSWNATGNELRHTVVRSLVADPADAAKLLAGTDAGVFRTEDGGRRWRFSSSGMPTTIVYGLARHPRRGDRVFAATAHGVFRSEDSGQRWTAVGDIGPATCLLPAKAGLLVGTAGEGIRILPLD